jgi:hypothetical protein
MENEKRNEKLRKVEQGNLSFQYNKRIAPKKETKFFIAAEKSEHFICDKNFVLDRKNIK